MRCRRCRARYDLRDTIHWSIPPGIPARPGESLAVVGLVVVATAVVAVIVPEWSTRLLIIAGLAAAIWTWHYFFYWWWERNAYDKSRPGTCPVCKFHNVVWPWSM